LALKLKVSFKPVGSAVATKPRVRARAGAKRRGWKFYVLVGVGIPFLVTLAVCIYFYIGFSRMIDARLAGETSRADPRVFARPYELRRGQALTPLQFVERLNDLGYSHRPTALST
jgi:hypothetical protein